MTEWAGAWKGCRARNIHGEEAEPLHAQLHHAQQARETGEPANLPTTRDIDGGLGETEDVDKCGGSRCRAQQDKPR